MQWVLLFLSCVVAQPSLPLLPSGVTIDMVKQIQVNIAGTVEFDKSTDNSATIANRLSFTPIISFDSTTGILSVDPPSVNGSSLLKPGLLTALLAAILCAFNINNKQHSALFLLLCLGLGVVSAGSVLADITIRVPGCFHIEGANGNVLVFDDTCINSNTTMFLADPHPVAAAIAATNPQWEPITPATAFYPVTDHGQHYLTPENQYEVWKQNFGREDNDTERQNFYAFTERCRIHNMDLSRSWTAACNQFASLTQADWSSLILADNAAQIAAGNAGRRLLSTEDDLFSVIPDDHRRKLLQSTSFTWVGTGKLTPVKDQGQCGSCYAHSTSSQMEAQLAIATNSVPVALSREQLKDCSSGAPGCNGGSPSNMFSYAASGALTTEANYPYVASNAACKSPLPALAFQDTGYVSIANNELAFKAALANGPIAVTVCASTWDNYAGGVFTNCASGCSVNHAVLLVGYGVDPTLGNYWLIQNSWNTWWGEAGLIRLPRTDSSTNGVGKCGLTTYGGYQAKTPAGPSGGTPCQGAWSAWTTCSKTCGTGSQSKTWTTTVAASGGGTPCPNPTIVTQSCNTALCPTPTPAPTSRAPTKRGSTPYPSKAPTPASTTGCLHVSNSVLGATGDGNYAKVADWNQGWCGTATNPQYYFTNAAGQQFALFFYATNCYNNVRTAGEWGLGPVTMPRAAYQWSSSVTITNGVVPLPTAAPGWTLQFSACS